VHGFAYDGGDGADVFAAGKLWHDTAVAGVDELRGDDVGEDLGCVAYDGGGGLVAGGFNTENEACRHRLEDTWGHRLEHSE
jgi:hypothetical protein